MSTPFDPRSGPILVKAEATGPARTLTLQLILDTGATTSLLGVESLRGLGFTNIERNEMISFATGSQLTWAPKVVLTRLSSIGHHRFGFAVIAHTLPISNSIDGLLGLDFLRGGALSIDFASGRIDFAGPN